MGETTRAWIGQRLAGGRYEVVSLLGEGGMGSVYRARDLKLDTDVVLKVPLGQLIASPEFAERFQREVRSLVHLSHPHVVKVTDVDAEAGLPFVVMQYLPGGSLDDRRPRDAAGTPQPLPPQPLLRWLGSIADALDFVHRQGYVHRDVKPANILFDSHDNAYLSDFGVAKALSDDAATRQRTTTLTGAGMVLGTPEYMAPELVLGQPFDGRADQYALAVMLFELLCGRRPIEGPSPTALLVAHTTQTAPPAHMVNPALPLAVAPALARGLAKDPAARYATCAKLIEAVAAAFKAGTAGGNKLPCPQCGKPLRLTAVAAGKQVPCPACQTLLAVAADLTALHVAGPVRTSVATPPMPVPAGGVSTTMALASPAGTGPAGPPATPMGSRPVPLPVAGAAMTDTSRTAWQAATLASAGPPVPLAAPPGPGSGTPQANAPLWTQWYVVGPLSGGAAVLLAVLGFAAVSPWFAAERPSQEFESGMGQQSGRSASSSGSAGRPGTASSLGTATGMSTGAGTARSVATATGSGLETATAAATGTASSTSTATATGTGVAIKSATATDAAEATGSAVGTGTAMTAGTASTTGTASATGKATPPQPPSIFDSLPQAVTLPTFDAAAPATESQPVTLGEFASSDNARQVELSLFDQIDRLKRPRPFRLVKEPGTVPRWRVEMTKVERPSLASTAATAPAPTGPNTPRELPVAEFRIEATRLVFAWADGLAEADANYLRNCVLQLSAPGDQYRLPLREPQSLPAWVVDCNDRETILKLDGAASLPEIESLNLELWGHDKLPPATHPLEGPRVTDDDELHLLLSEANPAVSLTFRVMKSGSAGTVRIRPEYQDPVTNTPAEFTLPRIKGLDQSLERTIQQEEAELRTLVSSVLPSLAADIQAANPGAATTLAEQNQRAQLQARLQGQYNRARNRAQDLDKSLPRKKQLLAWLPELSRVIHDVSGLADVRFRVFFTCGGTEIDVLRVGAPSAGADDAGGDAPATQSSSPGGAPPAGAVRVPSALRRAP